MFGIGPTELIIIGVVGVLLFGSQLPKVARSIGAAIPQFKLGMREVEKEVKEVEREIKDIAR
jgi:sec-independent protein translocase protein TatA